MASFIRAITASGKRRVFSSFASASRKTHAEANARFSTIRYQPHFSRHCNVIAFSRLNGFSTDAAVEPMEIPTDTGKAAVDPREGDEIDYREKIMKKLVRSLSPRLMVKLMERHFDERTAIQFFCWAGRQASSNIHEEALSSVARSWTSKVDKLASLLEEFKREGGQTYEPAWALMMRIKAYSNNVSEVVRTFSNMKESGCEPSVLTYNMLLRAFLMNKQFDDAVATWREMIGIGLVPNDSTVSIICFLLDKFVEPKEAVKFLSEMAKWDQITKHSKRLNKLFRTLARKANSNEVQELFTELVSTGFFPNKHSYASLVAAFYLDGKVEEAKKQLEELSKLASALTPSAFATIIVRLGEAEKWEEIIDIVELAKEYGCLSNRFIHTQRIKALFAAGRTHDAEEALKEMSKAGCTWDVETYAVMTQHYCNEGMVDRALELRNAMCETGCKADANFFQVLADGLCNANRIQEAIDLLPEMRDKGCPPNATVYRIIVSHISKIEDNTAAYELLTKMIQTETGKCNYITLMEILCEMEMFQAAEEFYSKMSQKLDDKPKCFKILVSALCRARKFNKVLDLTKRTRKWQRPVVCIELIKILFEQERLHDALPAV